jgi:hypothetical protein
METEENSRSAAAPHTFLLGTSEDVGGVISDVLFNGEQIWPWIEGLVTAGLCTKSDPLLRA